MGSKSMNLCTMAMMLLVLLVLVINGTNGLLCVKAVCRAYCFLNRCDGVCDGGFFSGKCNCRNCASI
jgi:hypothetical protein